MINVRAAANKAVQVVNPNLQGVFYASQTPIADANHKQQPVYAAGVTLPVQVQAVGASELRHLEGLNVQGVLRSVHMFGNTQGVVRVNQQGGDLLGFPEVPAGTSRIWKVVKVVETWRDWCHVIVNLQTDTTAPA